MRERSDVFVDYLDCTFSPNDNPISQVEDILQSVNGQCARPPFGSKAKVVWGVGGGKIVVNENSQWVRVSTSGRALEVLREVGAFEEYVNALGTSPNRVTRVDVTLDVFTDAPPIIKTLWSKYPQSCKLSRKAAETRLISNSRSDGVETGSFYVGNRKTTEVSAVVYDKQNEAWVRRGEMLPPTTRYEVRVKGKMQPTLADVLDPEPLFWAFAKESLLDVPKGISDWVRGREFQPWVNSWLPPTPAETMINRVNDSPELEALAKLAVKAGPNGPEMLERLVVSRLQSIVDRLREAETRSKPSAPVSVVSHESQDERLS